MKRLQTKFYLYAAAVIVLLLAGVCYYYFFSSFSEKSEVAYVYIDNDDTIDSVYAKISPIAHSHSMSAFRALTRHSKYAQHVRTGRYAIRPGEGAFKVFRHMKNGLQASVNLTIPEVRTMDRLAGALSRKLMLDSATVAQSFASEDFCRKYGYDTCTLAAMFIPNTYDIYWNVSLDKFMERMQKENKTFWNFERTQKAKAMKLTPIEVTTLASIIDEETANNGEKPMIAGMYYNRLMFRDAKYPQGMPLQADPTIKYAWQDFDLRRIYHKLLTIDSPYNTYRYAGLPPGPIRIPSVIGIESVLNYSRHNYLYMCAKEDFSGTHNFAENVAQHQINARKYQQALNIRNIK